ncbi:MAG: SMP-30/gluconolactonase/LRE family protein [Alphaproteobacteria bacterium]|nr:SMP-30/gluconolactonase/LRE family protein [Alphaproteobacteria bacterium]
MTEFRVVATGLRFPEGPIAMADGTVLLVEIERRTLTRIDRKGTAHVVATPGGGPNGAAIGPGGLVHVCNNGGFDWQEQGGLLRPVMQARDYSGGRIERIDPATGAVTVLHTRAGDVPLKGPNDLVFDADGGFWFTDLGKMRARDQDRGAVYYAHADGSRCEEVIFPAVTPNGIGLSPAGDRLYVAETEPARLWAWEIAGPGKLRRTNSGAPHGGTLVVGVGGYQRFDSLAVDAAGNICIATLVKGGITVVSPDGNAVEHVPLPDAMATNICFGGPDLRTAYVTLSTTGRLVALPWPRPGLKLNYLNK